MKFKTSSGTEYILRNVEMQIEATGEECPPVGPQGVPVTVSYTGALARVGSALRDLSTGGYFDGTAEFYAVEFSRMPEMGKQFTYWHEKWAGCYSTPVTEIEDGE